MDEAEADEADQDDLTVEDIPVVDPSRRRVPKGRRMAMAALAMSLLAHAAVAAVLIGWAVRDRPPQLVIQGGTGTADFGSNADGGDGPRDLQADLPGESSAAAASPSAPVSTLLPDVQVNVELPVVSHSTEELLPQETSPLFPTASVPAPRSTSQFRRERLNTPASPTGPSSPNAPSSPIAPSAASGANGAASPQAASMPQGVGGSGGSGAGGGAGRNGSGGPVGLAGNREPKYPPYEKRHGITGVVKLRIIILENGSAGDVSVVEKSGRPAMDESALAAVRGWRWSPALEGGTPAKVIVFQVIHFGNVETQDN